MKFGLIAQMQAPKPWPEGENVDHRIHWDTLAEAVLAEEVGFDYYWATRAPLLRGDRPQLGARGVPGGAGGPDHADPPGSRGGRAAVQPSAAGRGASGHARHPVQRAPRPGNRPRSLLVPHRSVRRLDRGVARGLGRGPPGDLRPLRQRHLPRAQGPSLRDSGAEARPQAHAAAASPALGGGDQPGDLHERGARGARRPRVHGGAARGAGAGGGGLPRGPGGGRSGAVLRNRVRTSRSPPS